MNRVKSALAAATFLCLANSSIAFAVNPQTSSQFNFLRLHPDESQDPYWGNSASADLMFITKYTNPSGQDYAIIMFGDTFVGGGPHGNSMGWSTDFDLTDGFTWHFKGPGIAQAMRPRATVTPPPAPSEPDATETQIWWDRSFVMGQDIYSYYGSFGPGHTPLGIGLAVIRGGISDFNNIPEFTRVSNTTFWQSPYWLGSGHPVIKTETDGNTYLYLFNSFVVRRVLFTAAAVENMNAYEKWTGSAWVPDSSSTPAAQMWDWASDPVLRVTCEWNAYLNKWVSFYSVYQSEDGINSQLAYRTADNILGPWSARTVIHQGDTKFNGGDENAGDCYSAVHRAFFDKDSGKTTFTFCSRGGSQGKIPMVEYTFNHTVTTTRKVRLAAFAPHGLDETTNVNWNGNADFYFRDTVEYNQSGNPIRTHPNSSLYTTTDFDAANGLTFDEAIKFKPLPLDPGESKVWLIAPFGHNDFVGTFIERIGTSGQALGTGFAATEAPHFQRTFLRYGGTLSPTSLVSNIAQVILPTTSTGLTVTINDPDDIFGDLYLAKAPNVGGLHPQDYVGLTDENSYQYSTIGMNSGGYNVRMWSSDENAAVPLFDNAYKGSLFLNPYTNGWIALYTARSSVSGANSQLTMRTAERLTGPWGPPVTLFSESNSGSTGRLHNAKYMVGFDKEGGDVMYVYASDFQTPAGVDVYEVRLR